MYQALPLHLKGPGYEASVIVVSIQELTGPAYMHVPSEDYAPVNCMHGPLSPAWGEVGEHRGDLLDLTLETHPRGGAIDTPFVSTEPSIWHAF